MRDESTTTKLSEALQRYLLEVTPTKKARNKKPIESKP